MIVLTVEAGFEKMEAQQLKKYPPIPRMTQVRWPWRVFTGQDHKEEIFEATIRPPDKAFARFASKAEDYVL